MGKTKVNTYYLNYEIGNSSNSNSNSSERVSVIKIIPDRRLSQRLY